MHNPDGTISTVRSISIDADGKTYLIPTVVDGKVVSNDDAIAHFQQTGQHLGSFADSGKADAYAERLHQQQAAAIGAPEQQPSDVPSNGPDDFIREALRGLNKLPVVGPLLAQKEAEHATAINAMQPKPIDQTPGYLLNLAPFVTKSILAPSDVEAVRNAAGGGERGDLAATLAQTLTNPQTFLAGPEAATTMTAGAAAGQTAGASVDAGLKHYGVPDDIREKVRTVVETAVNVGSMVGGKIPAPEAEAAMPAGEWSQAADGQYVFTPARKVPTTTEPTVEVPQDNSPGGIVKRALDSVRSMPPPGLSVDNREAAGFPPEQPAGEPIEVNAEPIPGSGVSMPVQGGLEGVAADRPTYRPENTPTEQQGGMALTVPPQEQPVETAGPMFEGTPAANAPTTADGRWDHPVGHFTSDIANSWDLGPGDGAVIGQQVAARMSNLPTTPTGMLSTSRAAQTEYQSVGGLMAKQTIAQALDDAHGDPLDALDTLQSRYIQTGKQIEDIEASQGGGMGFSKAPAFGSPERTVYDLNRSGPLASHPQRGALPRARVTDLPVPVLVAYHNALSDAVNSFDLKMEAPDGATLNARPTAPTQGAQPSAPAALPESARGARERPVGTAAGSAAEPVRAVAPAGRPAEPVAPQPAAPQPVEQRIAAQLSPAQLRAELERQGYTVTAPPDTAMQRPLADVPTVEPPAAAPKPYPVKPPPVGRTMPLGVGNRVPLWQQVMGPVQGPSIEDAAPVQGPPAGDGAAPPPQGPPAPPAGGAPDEPHGVPRRPGQPFGVDPVQPLDESGTHIERTPGHELAGRQWNAQNAPQHAVFQSQDPLVRAAAVFARQGRPFPVALQDALERAGYIAQPSHVPGVSVVRSRITPATEQLPVVFRTTNARANIVADLTTRMSPSRQAMTDAFHDVWGEDIVRPEGIRYAPADGKTTLPMAFEENGRVVTKDVPWARLKAADGKPFIGTTVDIGQHPADYTHADGSPLTDAELRTFREMDRRNEATIDHINSEYGTDAHKFNTGGIPGQQKAAFFSNINEREDEPQLPGQYLGASGMATLDKERVYPTGRARYADDALARLVVDPEVLWLRHDLSVARAAGNMALRAGLAPLPERGVVRTANVPGLGYLPDAEAQQVGNVLRQIDPNDVPGRIIEFGNTLTRNVTGGSAEMMNTHLFMGIMNHPDIMIPQIARGLAGIRSMADVTRIFSRDALNRELAENPEMQRFARDIGQVLGLSADAATDLRGGLLHLIPGLHGVNDATFVAMMRASQQIYSGLVAIDMNHGAGELEARAAAAHTVVQSIPMFNPTRAGLSGAGAQYQRFPTISLAMRRAAFQKNGEAARALVKLVAQHAGKGPGPTLAEQHSLKTRLWFLAGLAGMATLLQGIDAKLRDRDMGKALGEVWNPNGADFMTWVVPGASINGAGLRFGVGSVDRAMMKALWPQQADLGKFVYNNAPGFVRRPNGKVAFAGLGMYDFAQNAAAPWLQAGWHQISGKDWGGTAFQTAQGIEGMLQRVWQFAQDTSPIAAQATTAAWEKAESAGQNAVGVASSFVGGHAIFDSPAQQRNDMRDRMTRNAKLPLAGQSGKTATQWSDLTGKQQQDLLKANPAQATKIASLDEQALSGSRASAAKDELSSYAAIDKTRLSAEATAWNDAAYKVDPRTKQPVMDMTKFRAAYNKIQEVATIEKMQTNTDFKAFSQDGTLTGDPKKDALSQWFQTIKDSTDPATQNVDWEHQANLEADLRKTLTPAQQQYIDQRGIGTHAPELDHWLEARKAVTDSGYWDLRDKAVAAAAQSSLASRFPTMAVPTTSLGLAKAQSEAAKDKNTPLIAALKAVDTRAKTAAKTQEDRFRRANPEIDRALQLVYGLEPVGYSAPSTPSAGGGSGGLGSLGSLSGSGAGLGSLGSLR